LKQIKIKVILTYNYRYSEIRNKNKGAFVSSYIRRFSGIKR